MLSNLTEVYVDVIDTFVMIYGGSDVMISWISTMVIPVEFVKFPRKYYKNKGSF